MSIPSKEQLRLKYRISNNDFRILTEMPSESHVREKGFLIKVGEAFGAEEWMWKTWAGIILAVIIIVPQIQSTLDYWKPKAVYSASHFAEYFRHLQWPLAPGDTDWVAFVPDANLPPPPTGAPSVQGLSVGSGIFPAPAQSGESVPIQFISQIRFHFREHWPDAAPGEKAVSAPGHELEYLPLSQVVYSPNGIGRISEGFVPHLPFRFRVSVFDPELTVEVYHGEKPVEGFPQTLRHSLTDHWDSRIDFMLPLTKPLEQEITKSLLYENCFITYVNLVLGADDGLIDSALLSVKSKT